MHCPQNWHFGRDLESKRTFIRCKVLLKIQDKAHKWEAVEAWGISKLGSAMIRVAPGRRLEDGTE